MTAKERTLAQLQTAPWRFWSPRTKEAVAFTIADEIEVQRSKAKWHEWSERPVLRSEIEDTIRALNDLWLAITEKPVRIEPEIPVGDDTPVAMGEESAP